MPLRFWFPEKPVPASDLQRLKTRITHTEQHLALPS